LRICDQEACCRTTRLRPIRTNLVISLKKSAASTKATADQLYIELTAYIAGHINAPDPWTFYEELDHFLGPWGPQGYPLSFGKFYTQLFHNDPALQNNLEAWLWIQKTTIRLQEFIRDAVVELFQKGQLASLTEPRLNSLASVRHSRVFDNDGLALIVRVAPHLLPAMVSLPAVESASSLDYSSTSWLQTVDTLTLLSQAPPGSVLTAATAVGGRQHSAVIQRALATSGMNAVLAEQRQNAWYRAQFAKLRSAIESNRLNRIAWLSDIASLLEMMPLPDRCWREAARSLIAETETRNNQIANSYTAILKVHPEMRAKINELDPSWARYLAQPIHSQ
jgi:hypothetical protein